MKTVLISGAGIAGPTLSFWLKAAGFEPTLIERAPAIRRGGYVIDFWGLGYDIAERMGLIADINRVGYKVRELRIVNDSRPARCGLRHRAVYGVDRRPLRDAPPKRALAFTVRKGQRWR